MDDETHLLYILCHIAKHLNLTGAGVRMFMDVDVIIRHMKDNFSYDSFSKRCKALNIEVFTKTVFSLCKKWFDTPICPEYLTNSNDELTSLFENIIIEGGSFGFTARNLSDYYMHKGIAKGGKNGAIAKLNAVKFMLFPKKEYLKNNFEYAMNHPILIPLAWAHRIFIGIFKHTSNSKNTISGILKSDAGAAEYKKLLTELDI